MAQLIQCPTCGNKISENAVSCPHCGEPLVKKVERRPLSAIGTLPIAFLIIFTYDFVRYSYHSDEMVGIISTIVFLMFSLFNGLCAISTSSRYYRARGVAIAGFCVSLFNVIYGTIQLIMYLVDI